MRRNIHIEFWLLLVANNGGGGSGHAPPPFSLRETAAREKRGRGLATVHGKPHPFPPCPAPFPSHDNMFLLQANTTTSDQSEHKV